MRLFNVAQGPEVSLPLSHCLAAKGSDMNGQQSAVSRSGKVSMCRPGLPLPRGQSFARITIGMAGLVICDLSPTMSCQWA